MLLSARNRPLDWRSTATPGAAMTATSAMRRRFMLRPYELSRGERADKGNAIVTRGAAKKRQAASSSTASKAAMSSQPITIFSRSLQPRNDSSLKRRSQNPSGSSLDFIGATTAGLIMKPPLSTAHATAFGGNPKLQIPSSKQLGIRRRDHELTEFLDIGIWVF